jgi:hypothetical protein
LADRATRAAATNADRRIRRDMDTLLEEKTYGKHLGKLTKLGNLTPI